MAWGGKPGALRRKAAALPRKLLKLEKGGHALLEATEAEAP